MNRSKIVQFCVTEMFQESRSCQEIGFDFVDRWAAAAHNMDRSPSDRAVERSLRKEVRRSEGWGFSRKS